MSPLFRSAFARFTVFIASTAMTTLGCGSSVAEEEADAGTKADGGHEKPDSGSHPDLDGFAYDGDETSFNYDDGSLGTCTPACRSNEVCLEQSPYDIGCATGDAGAPPEAGDCFPGCPGCDPLWTACVHMPHECAEHPNCDCILQAMCGTPDSSFQSQGDAVCHQDEKGAWTIQCDDGNGS